MVRDSRDLAGPKSSEAASLRLTSPPFMDWSKPAVAELSNEAITTLPRESLWKALNAAQIPQLTHERLAALRKSDRAVLERLVHSARHCCRKQGY